jgi:hypothetical protein
MSNSRLPMEYGLGPSDRNRSQEKIPGGRDSMDFRQRYALQGHNPNYGRREVSGYRGDQSSLSPSPMARDSFIRQSTDMNPDKLRNIEKLTMQAQTLEAKNKQLFDLYSKNEKKVAEILKTAKDDNQVLLNTMKKLLTKPVINSEAIGTGPLAEKLISKLKEYRLANGQGPMIGGAAKPQTSQVVASIPPDSELKMVETENSFLVQELKKTNDCRCWVSALSHNKHPGLN